MDRKNIRSMVNLTEASGNGLTDVISKHDQRFPDRFYSFAEPSYARFLEPNYPRLQRPSH